jgi:hypothetical protein
VKALPGKGSDEEIRPRCNRRNFLWLRYLFAMPLAEHEPTTVENGFREVGYRMLNFELQDP